MARSTRARRRLTLLGILVGSTVVAGLASYGGVTWWRARTVQAARVEGYAKFEAGEYQAALEFLSAYVSKHREDVDALLTLAMCRTKVPAPNQRHLVDAAAFYRAALTQRAGSVEALNGLLDIYKRLGYAPELERVADQLLLIDPNHVAACEMRMLLAGSRADWKLAIEGAERLVKLEPDSYKWRAMHLELLRQSDPSIEKRLALIQTWIAAGEPDGRYQLFLADTLRQLNRVPDAQAAAKAAVDKGMPDAAMLAVLMDLLDALELPDDVKRAIDGALAKGLPPAEVVQMQVHRHFRAGRLAEAKEQLAAAGSTGAAPTGKALTDLVRWKIKIAELERDAVAADAAIAELRTIAQGSGPNSGLDAGEIARWLDAVQGSRGFDGDRLTSSPRLAMGHIQMALADAQDDAFLLLRAGDVAQRAGEVDEAARLYGRAFEVESSRWPLAGVREASALLAAGRTEEAFRRARLLVGRFADNIGAYFVFAQACDSIAREGRSPAEIDKTLSPDVTARVLLEQLLALSGPENPIFLPPLLATIVAEGDVDEAIRRANRAIAEPKTPVDTLLQIAGLLSDERYGDVPGRAIETAKGRESDPTDIAIAKARLQIARGEAGAARLAMRAALETAEGPVRAEIARVQAEAAMVEGGGDVPAALAEVLKEGGNDLESISFVLNQPASWDDEGVINAGLAKLGELIGETAPRTVLTNAARVLRFRRSSPQEISKAIQQVDKVLEGNAGSAIANITLARLFASTQPPDMAKAADYMKAAINLQPGRRDLLPELISMLQAAGDFGTANDYVQQYMRLAGDDTDQARLAAGLLIRQGQYQNAIPTLERVAAKSGTEADLVALGDAERRMGRMDQAEEAFKKALDRPDRSALSAMAYAEFLARAGRLDDARSMVEMDAKRPQPALTPANRAYLQARLELDYGDPSRAAPAIAEALRLAPKSPGVALLAARERLAAGEANAAIEIAKKGLEHAPNDHQLLAFVSSLLMADPASRANSTATLAQLKEHNPAIGELLEIVRACAGPDGSVKPGPEQLASLVELTNRYPSEPAVWSVAVELHAGAGLLEDAVRLAKRGMLRLPSDPGPAEFAARILLELRRPDEAREAARSWRALTADSPLEADMLLARVALIAGKPRDAVEMLQPYAARLRAEAAKRPDALSLYAAAQLFAGDVDKAFTAVRDGLQAEVTENRPERALLAEWLRAIRTAPTPAALDALTRTEAVLGSDDTAHGAMATEYIALARRKDAAVAIERAASHLGALSASAKTSPVPRLLEADLTAIRGDAAGASAIYQSVWEEMPSATREKLLAWGSLDGNAQRSLEGPRSIALFAANNQASTLAKAGVQLDVATTSVERALTMAPGDASLLETKAEVYLARKEYDQARQLLAPLVAASDASPSPRLVLARVELAAGRPDDARRQVEAAARQLNDDPFADRTLLEALTEVQAALAARGKPTV